MHTINRPFAVRYFSHILWLVEFMSTVHGFHLFLTISSNVNDKILKLTEGRCWKNFQDVPLVNLGMVGNQ